MIFKTYAQIGRVVYIVKGKQAGRLAVIVNIIDGNRILLDGPSTGVPRGVRNFKDVQLTKFLLPLRVGQRSGLVKKAFDDAGIAAKYQETAFAKKVASKKLRSGLTDFQRFKVLRLKQLRNRLITAEAGKLRKAAAKA